MSQSKAVNVIKIPEEQLLDHLGDADWLIALPDGLPDLIITKQWRLRLQVHAGKAFVRWVMQGIDRSLTHNWDPPWDRSGHLSEGFADPLMLLVRYELLSSWAENE